MAGALWPVMAANPHARATSVQKKAVMALVSAAHRAPNIHPATSQRPSKASLLLTSWIASIGKKNEQPTHRVAAHHNGHRQQDAGDELDHVLALLQGGQAAEREGRLCVGRESAAG